MTRLWCTDPARWDEVASAAPMGRLLAGVSLYDQLGLNRFFAPLLPSSREGTPWDQIVQTLVLLSAHRSRQRMAASSALV